MYIDHDKANDYRVLRQGDAPIRELDFYHIAGRQDLVDEIQAVRRPVARIKMGSGFLALAGFTTMASMYLVPDRSGSDVLLDTSTQQYITLGGVAAIVVGGLVWFLVDDSALSNHYMLHGWDTAAQVGADYNTRLGVTPPPKPTHPKKN